MCHIAGNGRLEFIEHLEGFAFVFDQWIALGKSAQSDPLAQLIECGEVAHPVRVYDVQHQQSLKLPHRLRTHLLFPSGAAGPGFLVTENFVAIKRYNISDAYALAIAHLADRLRGAPPFSTPWPQQDIQLSRDDRIRLQRALAARGYTVDNFVGQIDFVQRDAIRAEQAKAGMRPDGHPDAALLDTLTQKSAKPGVAR